MVTEERSFPPKGSSIVLNGYQGKEFFTQRVTNGTQWVTEERSFPPKGSPKSLNSYRRQEFSQKWVINGTQWLPRTRVYPAKGHQKPSMVTEDRSFPPKGSSKSLNSYRRKEFSAQRVTKGPQWLPKTGVSP